MWTRSEIKRRARAACKRNRWKAVLVGLLAAFLLGPTYQYGSGAAGTSAASRSVVGTDAAVGTTSTTPIEGLASNFQGLGSRRQGQGLGSIVEGFLEANGIDLTRLGVPEEHVVTVVLAVCGVLVALVVLAAILIDVFVINPTEVGIRRFFVVNLNEAAEVGEVAYAFDNDYRHVRKVMFRRDFKLLLWTLLLIIPGIVKAYEYRMVAYLLAEHPELASKEVFAESKRLMSGSKWRAFVLDLSFIGWNLLSLLTLGLVGVLYLNGYRNQTDAALYEALVYENGSSYGSISTGTADRGPAGGAPSHFAAVE